MLNDKTSCQCGHIRFSHNAFMGHCMMDDCECSEFVRVIEVPAEITSNPYGG